MPTREIGLRHPYLIYDLCVGAYEADECGQNNPTEQVCLFGGDIYDYPSLLRFYQNDDIPPWGNNQQKGEGENGPKWVVKSKFEDELAGVMREKKFHTKGIGEMLDQNRKEIHKQFSQILTTIEKNKTLEPKVPTFAITTRSGASSGDPPFPNSSQPTATDHIGGTIKRGGSEEKDDDEEQFLYIFKQIHVNMPFLEAMIYMPKGAKVLKVLLSHKEKKKRSSRTHKLKRLYKFGLTARVESSRDEQSLGEDASKQGRMINAIDVDEDITLVNVQDDADNEMFDVNTLNGEEVFVAGKNENVVEEIVNAVFISVIMTKVIKGEFEKLDSVKISNVSLTCNTSLEIFNEEFIRMSRMEEDLFTYEVEITEVTNVPCDLKKEDGSKQQMSHESDDDMEYDPSDARGDDEVELTDEESSDSDDEDEVAKIFRIETNMYLLKILMDLRLTKNIRKIGYMSGIKMCHGCMKDHGRRMEYGRNQLQLNIIVSHIIIKEGVRSGLPVAGKMMDIVMEETYQLHYQDLEWYDALKDSELKEEALRNKAIMEGLINEDVESNNEGWKS
ncbi:hypothetical protein Tco_0966714 [Tanacetum coccineum]